MIGKQEDCACGALRLDPGNAATPTHTLVAEVAGHRFRYIRAVGLPAAPALIAGLTAPMIAL
ncbi:hypothetical protein C731_0008 [Mycolicibacterium hassiacum DSM 44199]|uniref:Uncharacterized protein n=1 Tax=Mycolicibacterium hassiacum (strain DSM 44199 / CIP 105218 / JCM 12690 / 3849) TaxID=1122247 RepID=K5BHS5_MYCHD|nr:hypothetical protein [Mycolicibacterium hassiacum]EKF25942.1 hypothetical protein C731_0008 [Mycolicibacterium hassiacum DSM 44199]MDA4088421.1 hypothetical protein [Mycolicibacterium hassiacum DSM 44199]VCT92518.1 hypothetical protein MHAS_04248 [Mycolicibacterium hassiacum DSM 44199]